MRAKLGMLVGLVVLAVGIGAMVGVTPASGQRSIHVISGPGARVNFVDYHDDGLNMGDYLAARGPLLDPADRSRVGWTSSQCFVVEHVEPARNVGLYQCRYLLKLEDGNILIEGLDPHGPSKTVFAVVGGTGVYENARGQAILTDAKVTDMVIDLS
jgi:hypothetical protein